ncbi:hypothetical protein RhiirA1_475713 [Rhizophagus irregularis]|uniref:Uncharacterized protein n=1 Tax=Rhizophagus irregularis TaxID=588596 RepID=A0A2N0QWD5_9GLOM|nr:hypothetical protein RhiirA1_475713 [Rhizophagus irregularis]
MAMNNSSLSPIHYQITHGQIDWEYTKIWINYNPLETPTSTKLKNIQSAKIKKSNFNYPTGNILQRNYPGLYPSGHINCTNCNSQEDTNAHIGLCPTHRDHILLYFRNSKTNLSIYCSQKTTAALLST